MRFIVVLGGLTILISMGLALIVFGQHLTEANLTLQNLHLDQRVRARANQFKERQWLENLLKGQLDWKKKNVEEMEAEVNKLTEEEGKKKTEVEACQADKKQKEDELGPIQKEQSDIEATFKTEKETWTGEITTLKQQLEQSSKVCYFVKDSTDTVKLCPPKEGAAKAESAPVQGGETASAKAEPASAKAEAAPVQGGEPASAKAEVASAQAEASPVKAEEAPAQAEAAPVKAEEAPAQAEAAPAQAEAAPVKAEAAPVKAEEAPAQAEAAPAQAEAAPAQAEEAPVKAEEAPAQAEAAPAPKQ